MHNRIEKKKEKLRQRFLAVRKDLHANEVYAKSRLIFFKLINTEAYKRATTIHCYVSIKKQNEVETRNILQHMLDNGKIVVVPRMEKNGRLSHYRIESLEELTINKWGVSEPESKQKKRVETGDLDLIIVPMVAGDTHNNRLGYGKGYYDRFLSGISATKTGVLFDVQLYENRLPTDKFDVQMDMIITESALVE